MGTAGTRTAPARSDNQEYQLGERPSKTPGFGQTLLPPMTP